MVKISLNTVTRECIADSNFLGFEGENQANVLDFSFSGEHIDGTAVLNIKRGKDTGFVAVDKVGNGYQLPVRSSLLSQVGDITFQFVITTPNGAIMKFDSFVMTVEDAIDTDVPLPEEYPSWIEMANYKLAEVDAAITRANSTSNQLLQDKENGVFDGKDGIDGRNGINGISPTVTTEETATGAKITITDINGTHVAEILNGETGATGATGPMGPQGLTGPQGPQGPAGKDGTISFEELTEEQKATLKGDAGVDGKPGADGYSPTAKVSQTTTGATITITDKNGTTTANIVNGVDGKDGSSGVDGQPGKDGLTPFIGNNGNWWIGDTDTGVKASGSGEGGLAELPIATSEVLGGIKVGEGLEITEDGILSALGGGNGTSQTVLFEGKFLIENGATSETNVINDSVKNYDYILLTTAEEVPSGDYAGVLARQNTILIDVLSTYTNDDVSNGDVSTLQQWQSNFGNMTGANYYLVLGNFGDGTQLNVVGLATGSGVSTRKHYITKVVGIKLGGGTSGGSSYKEVDLINAPIEYGLSNTEITNINQDLVFNDNISNYDEIVFVIDAYNKTNAGYCYRTTVPILTSEITYSGSDSAGKDGDSFLLVITYYVFNTKLLNYYQLGVHWKNETTLRVRNSCGNSGDYSKFRIKAVKGIKY